MTKRVSARAVKVSLALILVSAGAWLVFRGLREYFDSQDSQEEAAAVWHGPAAPASPNPVTAVRKAREQKVVPRFPTEGALFSHLEVPRLNKSLYVVEGSDAKSLRKGPGHVRGSAFPGETGNCVIAGHRDLHFRFLKDIEPGDQILLETATGRFSYRVTGTKIISPAQISVLQPTRDAELHLITCYPFYFFGHAPKRFVVTAELEDAGQRDAASAEQSAYVQPSVAPAMSTPRSRLVKPVRHPEPPRRKKRHLPSVAAIHARNQAGAGGL